MCVTHVPWCQSHTAFTKTDDPAFCFLHGTYATVVATCKGLKSDCRSKSKINTSSISVQYCGHCSSKTYSCQLKNDQAPPFVCHHGTCGLPPSSPGLLIRCSGSSNSWPRNRSRIVAFTHGSAWKLIIKSSTKKKKKSSATPKETLEKNQGGSTRNWCYTRSLVFYHVKLKTATIIWTVERILLRK